MDKSAIKDGLGQVERELEDARQALRQLEAEILYHETSGGFEGTLRDVLRRSLLGQAYEIACTRPLRPVDSRIPECG